MDVTTLYNIAIGALVGVVGSLVTAIVKLYRKLEKREDELIQASCGGELNDLLKELLEMVNQHKKKKRTG
jgi:hypothetical protein